MKTFEQAMKRLPDCCLISVDNAVSDTGEKISSIAVGVESELQAYAENQDGCMSAVEEQRSRYYLKWLKA